MALVHVTTTNKAGHKATLLLDDEQDAERIDYLKTLVRREDLEHVTVKKVAVKKVAAKKAAEPEPAPKADED